MRAQVSPRNRQRGATLALVMVGLVAILAMAGLAFDIGHVTLDKARLQGVVDAAALAAAKTLYDQGATAAAQTAATDAATASINANRTSFPELTTALGSGLSVVVEFSNTVSPFTAGTGPPNFVRVRAQNFGVWTTLTRLVGRTSMTARASAVAGPQGSGPTVCNVLPVMMCADTAASAPLWGYNVGQLVGLKLGANSNPSAVGPGNYYAIRINGNGGDVFRNNLAGTYDACLTSGDSIETEPGNMAGPTKQGLNTRFNEYQGGMSSSEFPPDVIVSEPSPTLTLDCPNGKKGGDCTIKQGNSTVTMTSQIGYSYAGSYRPRLASGSYDVTPYPSGIGRFKRREVAVPIATCTGAATGQTSLPVVGYACVFLIQKVQGTGQEANIIGEVISNCNTGSPSGAVGALSPSLSYKIVLYDDSASTDS
jgi:Flp pilus assembly protein TadG